MGLRIFSKLNFVLGLGFTLMIVIEFILLNLYGKENDLNFLRPTATLGPVEAVNRYDAIDDERIKQTVENIVPSRKQPKVEKRQSYNEEEKRYQTFKNHLDLENHLTACFQRSLASCTVQPYPFYTYKSYKTLFSSNFRVALWLLSPRK